MSGRRTLRRATGAAVSLAVHGLLLAAILLTFRTFRRPPEPEAVTIELLPRLAAPELRPRPAPVAAAGRGPQSARPQAPNSPRAGAAPSPIASQPGLPAGAAGPGRDLQGVRAALRAAVGCGHDRFLQLTEAERARCAEKLGKGADPNVAWPAPIAPEKRAWFDAAVQARTGPGRPGGLGCAMVFGDGRFRPARPPAHALKLGPLPCYVIPPRGSLTADADVSTPSRNNPDQGEYAAKPVIEALRGLSH